MGIAGSRLVVIGVGSGIGLATADQAARRGAQVYIGGRDEVKLRAAAARAPSISDVPVDATHRGSLDAFFAAIGPFDHLVLCFSGGKGAGPFASLDEVNLRGAFDGKFWGQWRAAQAALPTLADRGSITFVTAASARSANSGTSGLAAVNGALNAMVGPLARELAPRRVNAVSPGIVDTDWWAAQPASMRESFFNAAERTLPVARVGQPLDVAEAILFLVGNDFTTGVVLDVDGGLRMASSP
jgi:NAD(P)-dependent dehydrogenase (short-subunit alcohol dehydrogenase family)